MDWAQVVRLIYEAAADQDEGDDLVILAHKQRALWADLPEEQIVPTLRELLGQQRVPFEMVTAVTDEDPAQTLQVPSRGGYIDVASIQKHLATSGMELLRIRSGGVDGFPECDAQGWSTTKYEVSANRPLELIVAPKPGCKIATAYPTQHTFLGQMWQKLVA
jgi:hypothetical protein